MPGVVLGTGIQRKALDCWARAGDEDVDDTAGGLLPAGFVGGVKDADESADEVVRVGVGAEIPTGDGALGEGGERRADQVSGAPDEARRTAGDRLHCGNDEHFAGDVIDEEHHPSAESIERRHGGGEAWASRGELFDFGAVDSFDEGVAGGEVAVERARADAGLASDLIEAGGRAITGKDLLGKLENALTVALRVNARLAGGRR